MVAVDIPPKAFPEYNRALNTGERAVLEDESVGLMRRHAAASKNWGILNLQDAARKYWSLCVSRMANHIASLNQIGKEVNTSRGADHDAIKVRGTWDMGHGSTPLHASNSTASHSLSLDQTRSRLQPPTSNFQLPTSQRPPPNILPRDRACKARLPPAQQTSTMASSQPPSSSPSNPTSTPLQQTAHDRPGSSCSSAGLPSSPSPRSTPFTPSEDTERHPKGKRKRTT